MNIKVGASIARNLLQINAIKLSPQKPFTWASGMKSPIYCDNRLLLSYPEIRSETKDALADLSTSFNDFDTVAGVATSGIPLASLLADKLQKPLIYVRGSAKSHGRQQKIEGKLEDNARVLVVEDLISTGGSCLKVVDELRNAGATVVGVLAIFSYEFQISIDNFAKSNCELKTLTNFDVLLDEALKMKYIKETDLKSILKWRINPEQWLKQSVN